MEAPISPEELRRRRGTLERLGEMLRTQRDRLQDYLALLDNQQAAILRSDTGVLLSYVELEESMVKDILNLQKVIEPLERLRRDLAGFGVPAEAETELGALKAAVERLGKEAAANAARNRGLLAGRMAEISAEIKSLRGNPHAARRSIYAEDNAPRMIDIEG
jgi:hypothetical protein